MKARCTLFATVLLALPAVAHAQHASPPPVVVATTVNPHGPSLKEPCSSCHRPDGWTPVRIPKSFKHAPKTFPLAGAHAGATCTSCHRTAEFTSSPATCIGCHQDVHRGEVGSDCARCHTSRSFVDRSAMTRMHQLTRFPLRAAHAVVACEACHLPARSGQAQFARTNTACASCHAATFRAATAPPHVQPAFSMNCTSCHGTASWKGAQFDHSLTLFPLTGGHRAATCTSCHGDGQYHGRSMECQSCHQADYAAASNPPHTQGFPTTCASCHTTTKWDDARFDHDQATRFALTGAHRTATCADCHGDNVYKGKPTTCVSCHQATFNATTTPNHKASGLPTTCETCHSTTRWLGARFDHAVTLFPLTGAHRAATCATCHGDGVYKGKPTTCVSCHQPEYDGSTTPNHRTSGFSTTCETCHTTTQWPGAVFDHGRTLFPLTGAHRTATCNDCHADGVYKGKPMQCVGCHQTEFNATTRPDHRAAGFPTACEGCHTTTQWLGAVVDHGTTQFPLTGAHRAASCMDCHGDGVYDGKPIACASCHQTEYNGTTNPPHGAAGFPQACESCHTTTQWPGATFNHAATQFPLTGAHGAATCADCHADGVYKGKPTTCVTCHNSDYSASTSPHHAAAGFVTQCQNCHGTAQWNGGTYDHSLTSFPLTGAHVPQQCIACHASKVYDGLPATCVACHLTAYNATANPNHQAAMFPTACQSCHTTTRWLGATFNHDGAWFPIYSGKHAGRWTRCSDCHVNPTNYKVFECLTCHPHSDKAKTDGNHSGQAGYSYQSIKCYACHPRGTH